MHYSTNIHIRDNRVCESSSVSIYGNLSLANPLRKELKMASLKKRREKWYARVQWWNNNLRKEKLIPLRTSNKTTARVRLSVVNKLESDIKAGMRFSFPWMNEAGAVQIQKKILNDVINEYLSFKRLEGLTENSIKRLECTLSNFVRFKGSNCSINSIAHKHIHGRNGYVDYCLNKKKPMTKPSVNLELRNLKTFFKWCVESEYLDKMPKITMLKVPKAKPKYLTERDICKILELENLDSRMKRIFGFYIATGVRRAEPFFGYLDGEWLIIPEEHTKAKKEKEIHLTPELLCIWQEMMTMKAEWVKQGFSLDNLFGKVTKLFKVAVRDAGLDDGYHLHNTRHTFAVRRYLQTGDIYCVKQDLGHSSVMVTEMYAEYKSSRLESDFPILTKNKEKHRKIAIEDTVLEDTTALLLT